jgi:hypothetical protein
MYLESKDYGGSFYNNLPSGFSDILDYLVFLYYKVSLDGPVHLGYGGCIDFKNRFPLSLLSVLLEGNLSDISCVLLDKGLLYEGGEIDFEGLRFLSNEFEEPFVERLLHLFKVRTIRGVPFRDIRRRFAYGMVGSPAIFKERPDGFDFFYDYDYSDFRFYLSRGYYSLYYFGLLHGIYLDSDLNDLEGSVLVYVRRKGLAYHFVSGYYADGTSVSSGYYPFGILEDVFKSYSYV